MSRRGKRVETESRSVVGTGLGEGAGAVTAHLGGVSFWCDERVLELDSRDGVQPREHH